MASPVLLVADDLSTIAAVKRVLAREGYEVILATNAADAVIAWGHHLPGLLLLQPSVEGDRGAVLLEELQQRPEAGLLRVVMLGETLPGYPYAVEPLPLEADHFIETLNESMRAAPGGEAWKMIESPKVTAPPAPGGSERDDWRATGPQARDDAQLESEAPAEVPHLAGVEDPAATPPTPEQAAREATPELEDALFGDLHRDIEAEAIASVESTLAKREQQDEELQQLEDEVRAEAHRRRQTRESRIIQAAATTLSGDEETSFADEASVAPPPTVSSLTPRPAPEPAGAREVLARAEAMVLESRAVADANRRADATGERLLTAELDALKRRAEHAEEQAQSEHAARVTAEAELAIARDDLATAHQRLETERAVAEMRLTSDVRAASEQALAERASLTRNLGEQLDAERQMVDSLQQMVDSKEAAFNEVQAKLDVALELQAQQKTEIEERQERLEGEVRANEQLNAQATELTNELARVSQELLDQTAQVAALEATVAPLISAQQALDALTASTTTLREERDALDRQLTEQHPRLEQANADRARLEESVTELQQARSRGAELAEHVVTLQSSLATLRTVAHESTNERDVLRGDVDRLSNDLAAAVANMARLTKDLGTVREALDAAAARAETAEAGVQLAGERLKELEHRATMPLALPGRRALGVARSGEVALEGLAKLVGQLVLAQADVRLELGVAGGSRVLWFKKGLVVAAESTLAHETLIDRARRDGLIDARQETELRLLKHAAAREQLEAMRSRGLLRELEAVPLAQRYTEQLALEAFAEDTTSYRLADDVPTSEVLQATVPRATLPMLAEAIRRALPVDVLLETLGGGEAVCEPIETELDLRALGFGDRERKMLSWVDGETTVEDLALASGLKQDAAFRALLVAKLLGLIEVSPPTQPPVAPSGDLEVQRLDAKYDEVLEADYFTILGLPKNAGTDDVQRAFTRLSGEFDPLKYSGHPDPALQQRAQVVFTHLEEAAKALEDERRRTDYARHLLD